LAVQWLRHHTCNARHTGMITGWGIKILHARWHGQKKKKIIIINKNMGRNNAYKVKLSDYYQVVLMPAEKS